MRRTSVAPRPAAAVRHPPRPGGVRWEAWLLRAVLVTSSSYALVRGDAGAALAALVALLVTGVPLRLAVPRLLELVFVAGAALLGISAGLDLFDRVVHWGKLVHGVEGACLAALVALLLLGHRDHARTSLTDQLAALATMLVGVTAGVVWELVEFVLDWVADLDLQKSNADTMTDFLWTDLGVVLGTLVAMRAYVHWSSDAERAASGAVADRLARPVSWLLHRHGHLMAALALLVMAAAVVVLWFTGRPIPGLPSD